MTSTVKSFRMVLILGLITVWRPQNWNDCKKSVWFAAQLLSSWMKFNMNAERYSMEQQENCVSTPEYNVSVLTELEGNNYLIFISFVHSPQMSNNLIGQGSSRSVLEACSRRSTIQSKTGADFSQVSETTFWTEVCVYFLK